MQFSMQTLHVHNASVMCLWSALSIFYLHSYQFLLQINPATITEVGLSIVKFNGNKSRVYERKFVTLKCWSLIALKREPRFFECKILACRVFLWTNGKICEVFEDQHNQTFSIIVNIFFR